MDLRLAALVAMVMTSVVMANKGTPPAIQVPGGNKWRENPIYIRTGNVQQINCVAEGNPTPTYRWLVENRNTKLLEEVKNMVGVEYDAVSGTLTATNQFNSGNDANFTCIASNDHGKAMTPPLAIEAAAAPSFTGAKDQPPEIMRASVSQKLKMECKNANTLYSKPPLDIVWQRGDSGADQLVFSKFTLPENMAVDPEGSLHFLWVNEEDFGFVYVCTAYNSILLSTARNTHSYDLQKIFGSPTPRDPSKAYWSDVTAMAGTQATLTCLFSYFSNDNERIEISWIHGGVEVGKGTTYSVLAQVPTVTQNVTGEYLCKAKLDNVVKNGFVRLSVISPPQFIGGQEPRQMFVPKGETATFQCGTTSYRTFADAPQWYVNAEPLPTCQEPGKMRCPEKLSNGAIKCVDKCSGIEECDNGEDEIGCSKQCIEDQKLCNGQCIPNQDTCTESPCTWPFFKCKTAAGCIGGSKVCNGDQDCSDNSDEQYCSGGEDDFVDPFLLSSDRKTLTLSNVQLSDQMCVQCSVSNQYGTVWGEGCLTVIDKIKVLLKPNATYNVEPGVYLNIGVDATTDVLYQNQMKYDWIMYNETQDAEGNTIQEIIKLPQAPYPQYFQMSQSGKNLTIIIPDVDEEQGAQQLRYDAYMSITDSRQYAVVISHPADSVTVNFTVIGVEVKPPAPVPVVDKASLNLWFIALILAVLILFVVIALIVCYMYRNRGGTYPLDKKEHQAGHDPAQELKDNAFLDVGRVDDEYDDDKPRADEVSLSESVKPYESDEDITAEYGEDLDLSKFNEEGSFIFQYGDKKSRSKEATV